MIKLRDHQLAILNTLQENRKGQVIVPTGGGKTMCMIEDAKYQFTRGNVSKTIVVVAPRILLAQQLCKDFLEQNLDGNYNLHVDVLHVHSGETHFYSTTNSHKIRVWNNNTVRNRLIFTTYHSLRRVQEAEIDVDTIYFDEAHNSVQKNFVEATEYHSMYANRCYFFTATPKHSKTPFKIGMNDYDTVSYTHLTLPTTPYV